MDVVAAVVVDVDGPGVALPDAGGVGGGSELDDDDPLWSCC